MDIYERSLAHHRKTRGKIEIRSRMRLETREDLSIAYTPGAIAGCVEEPTPGRILPAPFNRSVAARVAAAVREAAESSGVCRN